MADRVICSQILLRQALRPLADVLDPEEGPVILAYGIDQLAYALADRLACLGYDLTPSAGEADR